MIHWNLEQRTDEWFQYKSGKTSGSNIYKIVPGKRGSYTAARKHYIDELAQEIITGEKLKNISTDSMDRGTNLEPDAGIEYEMISGNIIHHAGFIDYDKIPNTGVSPDCLIGKPDIKKGAEIKCLEGANHTAEIISIKNTGEIITKYNYQIQFSMMCAKVDEWDYILYNPDCKIPELKLFYTTIKKDEKVCNIIHSELSKFMIELSVYVETLKELIKTIGETNE